jgi:hypothetical protein
VSGMSGRVALTERSAKSAETGGRRSPIYYDEEVIGFGLQVRDNGRKTFTLDYTVEGRRRRYFIGDYPGWSVASAREEAKRLKREVDAGRDPLDRRDERWAAPTVADLAQRYLDEHVSKQAPDLARDIRSMVNTHILPTPHARVQNQRERPFTTVFMSLCMLAAPALSLCLEFPCSDNNIRVSSFILSGAPIGMYIPKSCRATPGLTRGGPSVLDQEQQLFGK